MPVTPEELKRLLPNASADFLERNSGVQPVAAGPHPAHTQPVKGRPLVGLPAGDDKGGQRNRVRLKLRFTIRSRRPADWDAYHCKELQDLLAHAGIVANDSWDILQGEVISDKVHSKDEEGTLIELLEPDVPQR